MKLNKVDFFKHKNKFSLGHLTTESINSKTKNLSSTINTDLYEAIAQLKSVDVHALEILKTYSRKIFQLQVECQKTLKSNKVYISGCGATGRLALSIEKLYRSKFNKSNVVSFMAGGDYALIRSVESFEDSFDYGRRQLHDLEFSSNDLLLGVTEGGETSFVIGTVNTANLLSTVRPWFIYCNPDDELKCIKRSNDVINNENITKLNLSVGAMALSGSTRMQASTVQMIAIGFALLYQHDSFEEFDSDLNKFVDTLQKLDYNFLKKFVLEESSIYQEHGVVTYSTEASLGISILTDTTERAPTFSLYSFEKSDCDHTSLAYLSLPDSDSVEHAWESLLGRGIRSIEWEEVKAEIGIENILNFDISGHATERRASKVKNHNVFKINNSLAELVFVLNEQKHNIKTEDNLFLQHLVIKLVLNTHSTLVMGRLGRIESNMMSYVRPSNYKLIDRSARYVKELLQLEGIEISYEEVVDRVFDNLEVNEASIVLKVLNLIKAQKLA